MTAPKFLIELSDNEYSIVTKQELQAIEDSANAFDGITGMRVVAKIPEYFSIEQMSKILNPKQL